MMNFGITLRLILSMHTPALSPIFVPIKTRGHVRNYGTALSSRNASECTVFAEDNNSA